jgi:hypothetical protein
MASTMYATWMERLSPRLVFVKDLVLAIAEISLYNVHMNKQEQLAIDRATADAEWDERKAIITEAESDPNFATYLLGWMHMSDELEAAAKTYLKWKKS